MRGDASRSVASIRPLDEAGPEDLSFITHPRYRRAAASSRAAGLLAGERERLPGQNLIIVANPYAALAAAMGLFFPSEKHEPGISPRAVVEEGVRLGDGVAIGPCAVVGRRSILGRRVVLMPGVILGEDVRIGDDSILHPGVVVYPRSVLGARVVVHAGSVLGSDGFGYAEQEGARTKIPQVGNVVIEDDVEIGACTTIDRATLGSTLIERGTKIDNLVQVAHNVVIGEGSILVAQSGVAGSTRLGRRVILAGQAGVAGHLTLGEGAIVGAKSAALRDVPPGAFVLGHPAVDHRTWKRGQAILARLPDLLRRVASITGKPKRRVTGAGARLKDKVPKRRSSGGPGHRDKRRSR